MKISESNSEKTILQNNSKQSEYVNFDENVSVT